MEIIWADRVKNGEVLVQSAKEEKIIPHTINKKKDN